MNCSIVGTGFLRILTLATAVALSATSVMAQEPKSQQPKIQAPKIQIAALYTATPELFGPTCHGVAGSVSYNWNRWFSTVGDISGCKGTGQSGINIFSSSNGPDTTHKWFTYMAGPRVSYRRKLMPYAHILFGGAHASNSDSFSEIRGNAFATAIGIGADLELTERVSIRLIQPEYFHSNFGDGLTRKDLRLQTGVVFALN
jgi:opacity protein-like surface antigen